MDIIIISNAEYQASLPTSKQNIARALARRPDTNVLYVEPGFDPLAAVRNRISPRSIGARLVRRKTLSWVEDHLAVLAVPFRFPFGNRFVWMEGLNQLVAASSIRFAASSLHLKDPVLWVFDHRACGVTRRLPHRDVIYHRTDNFIQLCKGVTGSERVIERHERNMIEAADLVVVSARELASLPEKMGKRSVYVPHGVDIRRFEHASGLWPPEYADRRKVVICYQGSIDRWVDLSLIARVATMRPDWSIYLIGPVRQGVSVEALAHLDNVRLVGRVGYDRIPTLIAHADVCIIPFHVDALTRGVNPLKLWEYFACGKPVVSTPLPEVTECFPLALIAETTEQFVEAIQKSLIQDKNLDQQRRRAAESRSWDAIAGQILSMVSR